VKPADMTRRIDAIAEGIKTLRQKFIKQFSIMVSLQKRLKTVKEL